MFKGLIRVFAAVGLLAAAFASPAAAETLRGVGFGDSLMAGYQLPPGAGFPDQLEQALRDEGYDVTIADAGFSGDTTAGGLSRLDWSVPDGTDFVILELGGNDALRGLPPDVTRDNLDEMITRLKARGIDVLLAGIRAPPNMGADYRDQFDAIFADLADKHDVPLHPFFLEGAITINADGEAVREKMMADGIHPTAEGVAAMVERFMPLMRDYLSRKGMER